MIEVDVRVTADGVPVLSHDKHQTTSAGNRVYIKRNAYPDLQKSLPELATLKDALKTIGSNTAAYLEIKRGEPVEPIVEVIRAYLAKKSGADLRLASKSQKTLQQLSAALPGLPLIVIEPWSGVRATWRARRLNTHTISMNQRFLWAGFIRILSKHGYILYAYTLNDPDKATKWQQYGLAGVVTDFPDRYTKYSIMKK